ncbi:MAG: hypothetical protein DRJ47_02010 [Thermoprotei archaeon]|nr:MAG: hypothetical protein DRJ47_02010 [Thermoprotei archaeon]
MYLGASRGVGDLDAETYKRKYAFGEDYGTSYFKYGPVGEKPFIAENRGIVLRERTILHKIYGIEEDVIVGDKVRHFLGSRDEMVRYLIYPMRDGIVKSDDKNSWEVIYALTKMGLEESSPTDPKFDGFYVAAAISSLALTQARYMYKNLFDLHQKIDAETGLVKAVTIIPQPLAVAIAEKRITCIVIESGHGNTQICPISRYPIKEAMFALNRGGAEADAITAEILKDLGYGDVAREEKIVREIKEHFGLIPYDLEKSIEVAKRDWKRFRGEPFRKYLLEIDFEKNSWMRFLIGEIIFNPGHEIFESYYRKGMPRPISTEFRGEPIEGTISLADAIILSLGGVLYEIREEIVEKGGIILSGGNFSWQVPPGLDDVATDAATKVRNELMKKGIPAQVKLVDEPQFSVWKGCIVYAVAVPDDYEWDWDTMEGWYKWR